MKRLICALALSLAVAAGGDATAQTPRRNRAPSTPEESIRAAEEKRAARIAELEAKYEAQLDSHRSIRDRDDRRQARALERKSKRLALHRGLPWWKPLPATTSAAEQLERNWISYASRSGGFFLEHHVHALDRALWLLGNDEPVAVEPVGRSEAPAAGHGGDVPEAVRVRYRFASGVVLDASCRRSATPGSGTAETVIGSRGRADLLGGTVEEAGKTPWQADRCRPGDAGAMYQAGIDAFLCAIRSGVANRVETGTETTLSGRRLLRATGLAVMGRMAAEGRSIAWKGLGSPSARA
jgi:hypothetical protein